MGRTVFHARDYRLKLAEQVVDATRGHGNFVAPLGRQAQGVRGMRLDDGDCVVGCDVVTEGRQVFFVNRQGRKRREEAACAFRSANFGKRKRTLRRPCVFVTW